MPPKPQTVYIDIISRKRGKVNIIQYGGRTNGTNNERVSERISRVNKALQRAGQTEKAEAWNREYKEQQDYEAVWELARKYVTII